MVPFRPLRSIVCRLVALALIAFQVQPTIGRAEARGAASRNITITTPSRNVAEAPSVATIAIDRSECNATFYIPYIQTGRALSGAADVSRDLSAGGVEFVLTSGGSETVLYDMSPPYSVSFADLAKGEYTLDVYMVDAGRQPLGGEENHDRATRIGIGDVFVAIGDSVTEGYDGAAYKVPPYIDWLNVPAKSADDRNYPQCGINGTAYRAHWQQESHHIRLNDELAAFLGYPVFILNEGVAGINTENYANRMRTTGWQERIKALRPTKWLIHLGINDLGGSQGFQERMQTIINTLKDYYGARGDSIVLAVPAVRKDWQPYIDRLITTNGLVKGPDFNTYYANNTNPVIYVGVHPNEAGHVQMARLWALSMMYPRDVSVSQDEQGVTLSWASLSLVEPTIAGYKIKYGTTSGSYSTAVDVGNVTSYSITGLKRGQTYYFAVSAYDNDAYVANETMNSPEVAVKYGTLSLQSSRGILTLVGGVVLLVVITLTSAALLRRTRSV